MARARSACKRKKVFCQRMRPATVRMKSGKKKKGYIGQKCRCVMKGRVGGVAGIR